MIGDTATGGDLDALARRVSDRRMKRGLVTMGETMACISGVGPLSTGQTMILRAAGAESNVAIGVARLGHKARVAGGPGFDDLDDLDARLEHFVPTIGDGRHRSCIRDRVIRDSDAQTGLMVKERRLNTIIRVRYYRVASAGTRLDAHDVHLRDLEGVAIAHITGVIVALGEGSRRAVSALLAGAQAARIPSRSMSTIGCACGPTRPRQSARSRRWRAYPRFRSPIRPRSHCALSWPSLRPPRPALDGGFARASGACSGFRGGC